MTLLTGVQGLITEESITMFRMKELLMFLLGYAMNELRNFCTGIINESQEIRSLTPLNKIVDNLMESIVHQEKLITKQNLVNIFQTVLNVFQQSIQSIKNLSLNYDELTKLFLEILIQGFNILSQNQSFSAIRLQLESEICKTIQIRTQKSTEIIKQTHFESSLEKDHQAQEPIYKVLKVETQIVGNLEEVCQICCLSLKTLQNYENDKNDENESLKTVQISKCGHKYHLKCILQVITHHMKQHSSILYQNEPQQNHSIIQVQKDSLTVIKCPGYQQCSVHLCFSELHDVLLKAKTQKSFSNIEKLHSMAFNDYINSRNIMPFNEIKQSFENINQKQDKENSLQNGHLFFCNTKGCNAIYEINQELIKSNSNNQSLNIQLQNFTCLSCHQSFCLKCFSGIHSSMTCKEYAISSSYLPEDRQLEKFIKTLRRPYMKCPKCHFYVDNWRGCSTVTCRCGIRFCYKCGGTQCPYAKCLKEMEKQANKNSEKWQKQGQK